ncbi:39870_t:CDS:2 [Gigaspora margarita]|uniref:39870_t:CDS:1 n=1 Tax=Gigaspora margarita TaxID=4874 RepID=A0ABM8W600_GIGMA|nr:39870_t:CDS:2 [Gigaspora margarita]
MRTQKLVPSFSTVGNFSNGEEQECVLLECELRHDPEPEN